MANRIARFEKLHLNAISQGVASLGTLLVVLAMARFHSTMEFSDFSIAWTTVAFSLVMARMVFGYPQILTQGKNENEGMKQKPEASGYLAISIVVILLLGIIKLVNIGLKFPSWGMLFVLIPPMFIQDYTRFALLSDQNSKKLLKCDVLSTTPILILTIVSFFFKSKVPGALPLAVYLFGISASIFTSKIHLHFSLYELLVMLRRDRVRRILLLKESAIYAASAIGSIALIRIFFGSKEASGFNGALTVLAPIAFFSLVAHSALQENFARTTSTKSFAVAKLLGIMFIFSLSWTLCLTNISDEFGTLLLGQTWEATKPLLPVLGTQLTLGLFLEISYSFFRSRGRFYEVNRLRLTLLVVTFFAFAIFGFMNLPLLTTLSGINLAMVALICIVLIILNTSPHKIFSHS